MWPRVLLSARLEGAEVVGAPLHRLSPAVSIIPQQPALPHHPLALAVYHSSASSSYTTSTAGGLLMRACTTRPGGAENRAVNRKEGEEEGGRGKEGGGGCMVEEKVGEAEEEGAVRRDRSWRVGSEGGGCCGCVCLRM